MTITLSQVLYYAANPTPSPRVFSIRSKHNIIRKQLTTSIVVSPSLGLIHLN